jgi:hypothetical protein
MGKGNRSSSESDNGTNVNTGVAKSNWEKSLEFRETQLGSLTKPKKPHRDKVQDTSGHLDGGDGPWEVEDIEGLLIVDIVGNVEKVPQGKVGTDLESFCHSGFSTISLSYLAGLKADFTSLLLRPGSGTMGVTSKTRIFQTIIHLSTFFNYIREGNKSFDRRKKLVFLKIAVSTVMLIVPKITLPEIDLQNEHAMILT